MDPLARGENWALVPEWCKDGCQVATARQMLAAAEKLVGRRMNGEIVSQALWCDQGNHPFSARDPKSEHWERQVTNDKGEKQTVPWDVCGKCMTGINNRLAAIEAEVAAAPKQERMPNDYPA